MCSNRPQLYDTFDAIWSHKTENKETTLTSYEIGSAVFAWLIDVPNTTHRPRNVRRVYE